MATVLKLLCAGLLSTLPRLGFCQDPRIRWPSKFIKRVTTIGNLSFIALNSPSGNFASSESLTAITVVLRGV
uniref:Putative secreted protein n=1 Tax=Panstrongylus lignarius TaxID=156445 RepID=A0A224Y4Q4_9HEMI